MLSSTDGDFSCAILRVTMADGPSPSLCSGISLRGAGTGQITNVLCHRREESSGVESYCKRELDKAKADENFYHGSVRWWLNETRFAPQYITFSSVDIKLCSPSLLSCSCHGLPSLPAVCVCSRAPGPACGRHCRVVCWNERNPKCQGLLCTVP